MKAATTYFQWGMALALVIGLAGCGGYTTVDLGGVVSGLATDGLVLANGDSTVTVPAGATSFKFPSQIDDNASYSVTIQAQPAHYTCAVIYGTGHATGVPVTGIIVQCVQNVFSVGGTVTGLTTSGLVLNNGSDQVSVPANSTSFTLPNRIPEGANYGVTVFTQPTGQTCTVSNGTNTIGAANVTNIQVTCQ